jgi:hypothetical protein
MLFMNEFDIVQARETFRNTPVLNRATTFLELFANEANEHSDGWHAWPKPCRAATRLQELIQGNEKRLRAGIALLASEKDLAKALTPIKAFYTKHGYRAGMKYPQTFVVESSTR